MKKQTKPSENIPLVSHIAYYRKEDWQRFLEIIDDRDEVSESWEDWHNKFLRIQRVMKLQGLEAKAYVIDLDELQMYCNIKGVKNTGRVRSEFVSIKGLED